VCSNDGDEKKLRKRAFFFLRGKKSFWQKATERPKKKGEKKKKEICHQAKKKCNLLSTLFIHYCLEREREEREQKTMIGNYLSTLLVCVFAYLYPLFLCFKVVKRFRVSFSLSVCDFCPFFRKVLFLFFPRETLTSSSSSSSSSRILNKQALEMHKKSPEKLRGWCIYWLVLATFTVFERITDAFLFFLPLYHEAKVAFVVYLWHPKSQGALYIYDKFVAPTLSKHEELIDRKIEETQAKVGDVFFTYSKMGYAYVQKMTLQLLQSLPTAQAAMQAQQQQAGAGGANASEPVNPIKKEPVATEAK